MIIARVCEGLYRAHCPIPTSLLHAFLSPPLIPPSVGLAHCIFVMCDVLGDILGDSNAPIQNLKKQNQGSKQTLTQNKIVNTTLQVAKL